MSFSFLSLNVRGLKNSVKRKAIFLFCKEERANCIFFEETHSELTDERFWKTQWGDEIFFAHGTCHSAGVAILLNRLPGSVIDHKADKDGHWVMIVVDANEKRYIVLCIYGYNNKVDNKELLDKLGDMVNEWKISYNCDKVVMGGDVNLAPCSWADRMPHRNAQPKYDDTFLNLCSKTNVIDYWRMVNPACSQYTWFNPAGNGQMSRLDYWLISCGLINDVTDCKISASPLTDHCVITMTLEISKKPKNVENVWKFNNQLLLDSDLCNSIRSLVEEVRQTDMSDVSRWEWFKFKAKQIAINRGKALALKRKQRQKEVIDQINSLTTNNTHLSPEDLSELQSLQSQLDEIYTRKANGAYVRSRAKWIEQGEKSTTYFFGLEKHRQSKKKICKLNVNGVEIDDEKAVQDEIWNFYSNLYSSNYSVSESDRLFEIVKDDIKILDAEDRNILEDDLSIEEMDKALKQMKNGKSPGIDGLTTEFLKHFWDDIRELLHKAFLDCIRQGNLSPTMKIGL